MNGIKGRNGSSHPVGDRSCAGCDYSWMLTPTNRELKEGIVEVRIYCCAPKARVTLDDGTYPRLASYVREDRSLCGPKGVWWKLAQAPMVSEDDRNVGKGRNWMRPRPKPTSVRHDASNVTPISRSSASASAAAAPVRKPYKVK